MKSSVSALFLVLSFVLLPFVAVAQILDDDMPASSGNSSVSSEADNDEALFNELFSDYSETDRDITKIKDFNDALDQTANIIQNSDPQITQTPEPEKEKLPPIEGDLLIGVTNGTFRISKNALGEPACSFSVTLKSTLNRKIRTIALNLVYPYRTFAFMFTNIPENGSQEKFIRTSGDICYNLVGVPDIDINKCRIWATDSKECAARMKWDENLKVPENPDPQRKYMLTY